MKIKKKPLGKEGIFFNLFFVTYIKSFFFSS